MRSSTNHQYTLALNVLCLYIYLSLFVPLLSPPQIPCEAHPELDGCLDRILRLAIESKGAVMLQLVFSKMALCPGCSVMVYPMDPELQEGNVLLFRSEKE